jgi:hypothetical protein
MKLALGAKSDKTKLLLWGNIKHSSLKLDTLCLKAILFLLAQTLFMMK